MRLIHASAVLAAFALAACGSSEEEAVGTEELSVSEVMATADRADIVPRPGEYENTIELLAFDLAGMPAGRLQLVHEAFAEGAAQKTTYCVTERMTSEEWLSSVAESDCAVTRFDGSGGMLDMAMRCASQDGISGQLAMRGAANDEGSDMELTFRQNVPGMGDASVRMRVQSQRIGDCG